MTKAPRWWLVGGGAVVVTVTAAVTVVLVVAAGRAGPSSSDGCDLISRSTATTYAPGATCVSSEGWDSGTTRRADDWENGSRPGHFSDASIDVSVERYATPAKASRDYKDGEPTDDPSADPDSEPSADPSADPLDDLTVTDHRELDGLGDRAYFSYDVSKSDPSTAFADVVVLTGNREIIIEYSAQAGARSAIPRRDAENGALAIAKDALEHLN